MPKYEVIITYRRRIEISAINLETAEYIADDIPSEDYELEQTERLIRQLP